MKITAWPAFSNKQINPYNALLYNAISCARPDISVHEFNRLDLFNSYKILHIHWPESSLNKKGRVSRAVVTAFRIIIITLIKLRGTKIVWTVHNLSPHEGRQLKLTYRWLMYVVDGFIFFSNSSRDIAIAAFPQISTKPTKVIPHGLYTHAYPNNTTRSEARSHLGLPEEDTVLLFLGQLRQYKNISSLIYIASRLPEGHTLLIAGMPNNLTIEKQLNEAATRFPEKIKLFADFIKNNELQYFLKSADAVILPYAKILNSGTLMLAMTFGVPTIIQDLPQFREQQATFGNHLIRTFNFNGNFSVDELLALVNTKDNKTEPREFESKVSWEHIAMQTSEFYELVAEQ